MKKPEIYTLLLLVFVSKFFNSHRVNLVFIINAIISVVLTV